MGLLDEASDLLGERATLQAAQRAAAEAGIEPWSADWTKELAELLTQHRFPAQPTYIQGELSKRELGIGPEGAGRAWYAIQNASYWGEAWALQGWKLDSEWGPRPVEVLLDTTGALWGTDGSGGAHTLTQIAGSWSERGRWIISYPDIAADHRKSFFLAREAPRSIHYGRLQGPESLRTEVGVSVVAALQSGQTVENGWIIGLKP